MGCNHLKGQALQPTNVKVTPVQYQGMGLFKVRIGELNELRNCGMLQTDTLNYARLSFSNQTYTTNIDYSQHRKISPGQEEFYFVMNQIQKKRCLQVQLFSKTGLKRLTKLVTGRQVFNETLFKPINGNPQDEHTFNLKLVSQKDIIMGYFRVFVQFIPQKCSILNMKVNSVTLRNNPTLNRKIYLSIQIGGEIFQSESSTQNIDNIPTWSNAFHSFIVPQSLLSGKLNVYEKNQENGCDYLLGQLQFDLKVILSDSTLQFFSEEITLKNKITGTVKLQFLKTQKSILQLTNFDPPRRIKLNQEIKIRNDFVNKNKTQNDTYKKATSLPKTNCTENQRSNSLSSFKFRQKRQKQSQLNFSRKSKSKTKNIFNLAQQSPKLNKEIQSILNDKFEHNSLRKKLFDEEISNQSLSKLNIDKTSSLLIQKNSNDLFKEFQQHSGKMQKQNKQQMNKKYYQMKYQKIEFNKQNLDNSILHLTNQQNSNQSHQSKKQINSYQQKNSNLNNYQRSLFYVISNDLSSKSFPLQNNLVQNSLTKNQSNDLQLSLKELSIQNSQEMQNRFQVMENERNKINQKYISIDEIQKRQLIKGIGLFS